MRILLVEDDLALAAGMEAALQRHGHELHAAPTGEVALTRMAELTFDLVLLDIGLPGLDGLAVLQRLRQMDRRLPVILITARDAIDDRIRGLDAGADDYLVKPVALDELAARIRVVARRARLAHSTLLEHGPLTLDCDAQRAWLHEQPLELTLREWRALETLLRRVERVVPKLQLQEALASSAEDPGYNAAEVYVSRLRAKLDAAGIHIRTVRGFGYMLEEYKGNMAS
jgi:DNA-binding response OmpR family regulator